MVLGLPYRPLDNMKAKMKSFSNKSLDLGSILPNEALEDQDLVLSPKQDEEEDLFVDEDSQIFMPKLLSTDPDA
jgi:hypothetical protein